jgi:hypothetical protein
LPGAGIYVAPSLNHTGCVITTNGVFPFSFLFFFWETTQKQVFEKHITALNRLAAIANLPGTQELSPTLIAQILQERSPEQAILLNYRRLFNSSFTGLLDTHINTSAHKNAPESRKHPNPTNCPSKQHPHYSHAQQNTTGTPLQTT